MPWLKPVQERTVQNAVQEEFSSVVGEHNLGAAFVNHRQYERGGNARHTEATS
jgi:hypothetical protein